MNGLSFRFLLAIGAGLVVFFGPYVVWAEFIRAHEERATSWQLEELSDDGRNLVISYRGGKCDAGRRVERRETATEVRLHVFAERPVAASCDDITVYRDIDVRLDAALGDRRLVDARTGRPPEFGSR